MFKNKKKCTFKLFHIFINKIKEKNLIATIFVAASLVINAFTCQLGWNSKQCLFNICNHLAMSSTPFLYVITHAMGRPLSWVSNTSNV